MKKQITAAMVIGALLFVISAATHAVPITDVKEYSNNTATEYFVKDDASKYSSPYYRNRDQDWGWTHSAIAGTFTSILLDISAFDVDTPYEKDAISVYDGSSWLNFGNLVGTNNTWDFTQFDLTSYAWANAQVNAGLQVKVDIDTVRTTNWLVTLGKSTLTLDGGSQTCVPTPGVPCTPASIPEPSTLALLLLGLAGLGFSRRNIA